VGHRHRQNQIGARGDFLSELSGREVRCVATQCFEYACSLVMDWVFDDSASARTGGIKVCDVMLVCVGDGKPFGRGRPADISRANE
jgi:hypothetical protein